MTAHEPPNPYTAPSAALVHEHEPASPGTRRSSRLAAFAAALLAYPIAGAGFYILGQRRRFVAWTVAGLLAWAVLIISVWAPVPKLCVVAFGGLLGLWLPSLIATGLAKPVRPIRRAWLIAVLLIVGARVATLAIKEWLVEAFQIPSGAMVPALLVGDHIMAKKGRHVERGDIVVFAFPQDRRTDYVKRVVAMGGDTVEVTGGIVSINGVALAQSPLEGDCAHAIEGRPGREPVVESCKLLRETNAGRSYTIMTMTAYHAADFPRTVIPDGRLFVMGDNRDNSYDSRRWGTVPIENVKGKATLTWWSKDPAAGVRWSRVGRGVE